MVCQVTYDPLSFSSTHARVDQDVEKLCQHAPADQQRIEADLCARVVV